MDGLTIVDGRVVDHESSVLEFKRCKSKLSRDFWPTYSSFANTFGGVVYLGIDDATGEVEGVDDPERILKEIWDLLDDPRKVSVNLLSPGDVSLQDVAGKNVVRVCVPRADRRFRPVYVNGSMENGAYKRNGERDYHCSISDLSAFLRESSDDAQDSAVLANMMADDLDRFSVESFRRRMAARSPHHPWSSKADADFLRLAGAAVPDGNGELHPTLAGLLMFGVDSSIMGELPNYRLDYLENADGGRGWTHRISTGTGESAGNLYWFMEEAGNRLMQVNDRPKDIGGMYRTEDTPIIQCQRELLVNALVHADYRGRGGIRAEWSHSGFTVRNPGNLRIPLDTMMRGGFSDPRNPHIAVMFGLIGLAERAGSGVSYVAGVCRSLGMPAPVYSEASDPQSVTVAMDFGHPDRDKSVEDRIREMMSQDGKVTLDGISSALGIERSKARRTIERMKSSGEVERVGGTRGRWVVLRRRELSETSAGCGV